MKVVHVCLGNFFIDNHSYQENLLPKYQKKLGYEVEVIASLSTFNENGEVAYMQSCSPYMSEDGIKITRLDYKTPLLIYHKLKKYIGTYDALKAAEPDVIFIHGSQFVDMYSVAKYVKKNPGVTVYVDNHADFKNSAQNFLSKNLLHKFLWRMTTQKIEPYTTKFYGVLPARVSFLKDIYKVPEEKCELLVMGADDEPINEEYLLDTRNKKRKEYDVENNTVIMTGGKIDHNKPQTISLMKAINEMENENIKLLVFGSVVPELKAEFEAQLSDKVKFIGWKKSNELYGELSAADIVAFPGLHSVLWEQTVAMGKPCIFKKIDGFTHIDIGGNCLYFEEDSVDEYKKVIKEAISSLDDLKKNANKEERKQFLYSNIARKSIGE